MVASENIVLISKFIYIENIRFHIALIFPNNMLIESNRLHQKIKKLKEDLAKEKELRREAEKQLKIFKEAFSLDQIQRNGNSTLEITDPTNIAVFVRAEQSNNSKAQRSTMENARKANDAFNSEGELTEYVERETEESRKMQNKELMEFMRHFSNTISNEKAMETALLYKEYKRKFSNNDCLTLDTVFKMVDTNTISLLFKELIIRFKSDAKHTDDSWAIYRELFSVSSLLNIPDIWILDIMEEFVYKFQTHLFNFSHDDNQNKWDTSSVINTLTSFLPNFAIEISDKTFSCSCLAITQLIRIYIALENHQNVSNMVSHLVSNKVRVKTMDTEVIIRINYEIGFSLLVLGKFSDAVQFFLDNLTCLKKLSQDGKNEMSFIKQNTGRCIGFCISSNPKVKKTMPKNIVAEIASVHQKCIEEWKDGKVESFWKFFAECSPYISRRESSPTSGWKEQSFKHVKFCLQRVTMWKPLKNLKGLFKVMKVIPFAVVPMSILPVTTGSDIQFFCDNNNGLNRLVNSKSSAIDRVLEDFPNIHRKETLTLLIMQYHKILLKQKNEDKLLTFGRKFMSVLKAINNSEKIDVDDVVCYMREVSKISMDEANQFVESQCAL